MIIKRILNNNAILSLDAQGEEIIVKGKGIAYCCNNGDEIKKDKIEKIFVLENKENNSRYEQLLAATPQDCIEACEVMIDVIKQHIESEMSDKIYITLTDHIHNLLERIKMGITFDNALLWDVKRLYTQEYKASLIALDVIRDCFDVKVDDGEAAFVALHIVNAQLNTEFPEVIEITRMIDDMYEIVESTFDLEVDKDCLEYTRFIMHLRVFFERILRQNHLKEEKSNALLQNLIQEYPEQYRCVQKILKYVSSKYDTPMDGEVLYLLVHIVKLTDK